ncbi:MAG: hypothetical protein HYS14_08895 [Candidatus Rokubacteria bacterium]|nr:hypothetical protein [Candidatus Rokubacteria bacterium]
MADFVEEIERFLASFSPEENTLSRHAFRALLDGQPATVAELPAALGLPPAVVEAAVENLTKRGTMVVESDTGRIVGVRGLSLVEANHRFILEGRELYAWCAVDAVGIPAALGADARVDSHCHHCRAPLTLELKGGTVEAPDGLVIWAVERDLTRSLRTHT